MSGEQPEARARVSIRDDWLGGGINVTLGIRHSADSWQVIRFKPDGNYDLEQIDPATMTEPTFRLIEGFGPALLDALLRFYQGSADTQTIRSDLLHERGRVDKLTDAVISIAKERTTP